MNLQLKLIENDFLSDLRSVLVANSYGFLTRIPVAEISTSPIGKVDIMKTRNRDQGTVVFVRSTEFLGLELSFGGRYAFTKQMFPDRDFWFSKCQLFLLEKLIFRQPEFVFR